MWRLRLTLVLVMGVVMLGVVLFPMVGDQALGVGKSDQGIEVLEEWASVIGIRCRGLTERA